MVIDLINSLALSVPLKGRATFTHVAARNSLRIANCLKGSSSVTIITGLQEMMHEHDSIVIPSIRSSMEQEGKCTNQGMAKETYFATRRNWLANAVHIDIDQHGRIAFPVASNVDERSGESLDEWSSESGYFSTRRKWLDNEEHVDIDLFGRARWAMWGINSTTSYGYKYLAAHRHWTTNDASAAHGLVGVLEKWTRRRQGRLFGV